TILDGEGAEAAQLDAVAARHRSDDLAEDGVDDVLHVALIEVRVLRRDALHELGFDHRSAIPDLTRNEWLRLQFADEGCQSANRPSGWSRSTACTVDQPSSRRANAPRPTASSVAIAAVCRKGKSLNRSRSR